MARSASADKYFPLEVDKDNILNYSYAALTEELDVAIRFVEKGYPLACEEMSRTIRHSVSTLRHLRAEYSELHQRALQAAKNITFINDNLEFVKTSRKTPSRENRIDRNDSLETQEEKLLRQLELIRQKKEAQNASR